jgi:hypothetical protein
MGSVVKTKDSQKFRFLYRLLDESGLEWLSDEVRLFRVASSFSEVANEQAEAMRRMSKLDEQIKPQLVVPSANQYTPPREPKNYKDCIQYLIERIGHLAMYLEEGVNLSEELGISSVQLGQEPSAQKSLAETARQLKEIEQVIREIVPA